MNRLYSPEELDAFGEPAPALVEHMRTRPKPPAFTQPMDINAMRKVRAAHLETRRPLYPIKGPIPDTVAEKDVYIPYPPLDTQIQVRVYSPTRTSENQPLPVVVLFHEGGFMVGDISDEEHNARLFASTFDCVVLNVEYLLGPGGFRPGPEQRVFSQLPLQ